MNLRSIAPVLLLCLLLAGCGAAEREEETGALESAAGLTENQEDFLTVDGEAVPAWRYLYWLAMDCRRLEEQYAAGGRAAGLGRGLIGGRDPGGGGKGSRIGGYGALRCNGALGYTVRLRPDAGGAGGADAVGQPMAHRGAGDGAGGDCGAVRKIV